MPSDKNHHRSREELLTENEMLRLRLEEAEETLRAMRSGEVDAIVVSTPGGNRIFTLEEAEKRYRILVETMNEGAATLGPDGTILYCNSFLATMFNIPQDKLIGSRLISYVAPPDAQAFASLIESYPEKTGKGELQFVTGDGHALPILLSRSCQNESHGFTLVLTDLSEQKHSQQTIDALSFSEARYRALFLDNPAMIVMLDAEGTILSANPSCSSQLGYTKEELEGQSGLNLFLEDDRAAVAVELRKCLENPNQVQHWQFRKIRKNGELLWVEETVQAVYSLNGTLNILLVCQDVTVRKRAEEEREQLNVQLEAVLNSITEGVAICDLEGNLLTMNPSALALHGYESIEQVRQQVHRFQETFELSGLDERPIPYEQWPMTRVLRGERFTNYEVRLRRKDTGKLWIASFFGAPVKTKSGETVLAVVTFRDITQRKLDEEEIKELNVGLAAWTAELEAANKDLEAFNYTVAHDLRNPLNVIGLSCQAMKELCGDQLTEECMNYVQDIYNGVLHMNRLIEALLKFSLMGRVELHREKVLICKLAHEVATMLKQSEPQRQVDFRITDGITVDADANLVRVVLDNLLGNAWKYTAMREEAVIEFGTTEIGGKQVYFVRDNGAGFDLADAGKLFVAFKRLPGVEEFKGSGIGLATAERIIKRHCGKIWAEGEPGKGACFYFTLSAD